MVIINKVVCPRRPHPVRPLVRQAKAITTSQNELCLIHVLETPCSLRLAMPCTVRETYLGL